MVNYINPPEKIMNKEFQILKDRPTLNVSLTRDSVCMGDDSNAPHERMIEIKSFIDPVVLAKETSSGYIASVSGHGHKWTCVLNDVKIAVIDSEGIHPLIKEVVYDVDNKIHFIYKSSTY